MLLATCTLSWATPESSISILKALIACDQWQKSNPNQFFDYDKLRLQEARAAFSKYMEIEYTPRDQARILIEAKLTADPSHIAEPKLQSCRKISIEIGDAFRFEK